MRNFTLFTQSFLFLMFFIFFPKKNNTNVVSSYPDLSNVKPLLQAFSHNDYEQQFS